MTETNKESDHNLKVRNPEFIRIILNDLVEEIATSVSAADFQREIKTLNKKTATVKTLYEIQKQDFINEGNQSVDNMYNDAQVEEKYNALTNLINSSKLEPTTKAWRPDTGNSEMQLLAHRKEILLEKKSNLEKMVQEQRNIKFIMKKQLEEKRNNLENILKQIENVKTKLLN